MHYTRRDLYRAVILSSLLTAMICTIGSFYTTKLFVKASLTQFVELQEDLNKGQTTVSEARASIRSYYLSAQNLPDRVKDWRMHEYSLPLLILGMNLGVTPPEINVIGMGNTTEMKKAPDYYRNNRLGYERLSQNTYRLTIFNRHGDVIKVIEEAV